MIVSHTTGELYDIISLVHANARTDLMNAMLLLATCVLGLFAVYYTLFLKELHTYPAQLSTALSDDDDEDLFSSSYAGRRHNRQRHSLKKRYVRCGPSVPPDTCAKDLQPSPAQQDNKSASESDEKSTQEKTTNCR